MNVHIERHESHQRIEITGFLDGHTAESREVLELLEESHSDVDAHQVLDLSQVEYVNSHMLGEFLRFLHAVQRGGYQVLLMNPPPTVANVLELTGLSALLPVVGDAEEIEQHLATQRSGRPRDEVVDYEALADEIESMVKGEPPANADESQLGRILED